MYSFVSQFIDNSNRKCNCFYIKENLILYLICQKMFHVSCKSTKSCKSPLIRNVHKFFVKIVLIFMFDIGNQWYCVKILVRHAFWKLDMWINIIYFTRQSTEADKGCLIKMLNKDAVDCMFDIVKRWCWCMKILARHECCIWHSRQLII